MLRTPSHLLLKEVILMLKERLSVGADDGIFSPFAGKTHKGLIIHIFIFNVASFLALAEGEEMLSSWTQVAMQTFTINVESSGRKVEEEQ